MGFKLVLRTDAAGCQISFKEGRRQVILIFLVVLLAVIPLSATDSVLLKYCSSTMQALSLTLLETPQEPWQLTLMAARREESRRQEVRRSSGSLLG